MLLNVAQPSAAAAAPEATLSGSATWAEGTSSRFEAHRTAAYDPKEAEKKPAAKDAPPGKEAAPEKADEKTDDKKADVKKANDEPKEADKPPQPALFAVNYPFGDFGRPAIPEQPKRVVFRHATVWTCGPQGVLTDASVLVNRERSRPSAATLRCRKMAAEIDAKGLHITPGIIDCHSHIATDGG